MKRSSSYLGYYAAPALMGLSMACATIPPSLEQARQNYQQLQQDPQVAAQAPVASYEANQALRRTEQAWEQTSDEDEVKHLAYLTNRRVEIARETAQQKAAEAEAQQLKQEREKVLLETRTREAERAKQLAESRAREVQIAQQDAEARARESQEAQIKAQAATDRAAELERRFAELKAKQTDRGFELTLSDVLFEFDKAALKAGSARSLAKITEFLRENPQRQITIEGYTDNVGSDNYNLELSQRRAEAVRDFLVQNGISADRITARGLGEEYPVASNETEAGRQQNRRVQIIIVDEKGRAARP
ncbi:MAG TPA: OmpA family protein [Candidatus Binatia bacterium]|nr:OmpA family protein [Candidatus Binatia bacterium]